MALVPDDRPAGFSSDVPPLHPLTRKRSGAGKYIALLAVVAAVIVGWSGFWFYAAHLTEETLAGWRLREAKAGNSHHCAREELGGYPFRIEVHCSGLDSEFRNLMPPLQVNLARLHVATQIYQPNLLIAELEGPLAIGEVGRSPIMSATWELAQASLRGTPSAPERLSMVFQAPVVSELTTGTAKPFAQAERMEWHGRIAEGSAADHPVIETVLRLTGASFPGVHQMAVIAIDADITARLNGLSDFAPKPWAERLRDIQAAGGSIEVVAARVAQGETVAVGSGTLGLKADGHLDGRLRLTVAGLEPFLKAIGIEHSAPVDRIAGALDRFLPGLGAAARAQAGAGFMAGMALIGEPATLEGRKAVTVPLRLADGLVYLGPLQIGRTPPLF
jgi:hypothetical protein